MVALHQDRVQQAECFADGVSTGYRHYQKRIEPKPEFRSGPTLFKWYDIGFGEFAMSPDLDLEARAFLENELQSGALDSPGRAGFAILHDCGEIVFLLVSTWCGNNELWESVYIKRPDLGGSFRPMRVPGDHRPTFCVWEMAVVAHEARAWSSYLLTDRTNDDLATWLSDLTTGMIS